MRDQSVSNGPISDSLSSEVPAIRACDRRKAAISYGMRYFTKIKRCSAVLVAISALCLAPTSEAQLVPGARPGGNTANKAPANAAPQPTVKKLYPVWVGYIVIGLMIGAVMGVSLMPSKRSHQD